MDSTMVTENQESNLFDALIASFSEGSGMQDSNLRPLGPKPSALPNCANSRKESTRPIFLIKEVGWGLCEEKKKRSFVAIATIP